MSFYWVIQEQRIYWLILETLECCNKNKILISYVVKEDYAKEQNIVL